MPEIITWETGRSKAAVACACGGVVTNVLVGFRMSGQPASVKGRERIVSALSAPKTICANTTRS